MHDGMKFYRGSATAARAYVEQDRSRADDYFLAEGSGVATVNNFHQQFINEVAGSLVQNVQEAANLGPEARQLMDQILQFGGKDRDQLETAVHELQDDGARGADRLAARGRLQRFLADRGNRGWGLASKCCRS